MAPPNLHVYSFDGRHADQVRNGTKRQTVRPPRKRGHAEPGHPLRFYTGMRTRACALLGEATCTGSRPVEIDLETGAVQVEGRPTDSRAFALASGFEDVQEMVEFYKGKHGAGVFRGVMIEW